MASAMPKSQGLHSEFVRRLELLALRVPFFINSGYRSSEKQAQLFNCFKAGRPGCAPANPPGTSNHEAVPSTKIAEGLAADINGDFRRLHAAAKACGLHFPIRREPWHVQPVEAHSPKYVGRVLGPATAVGEEEEVEMFTFAVKSADRTRDGIWLLAGDGKAHQVPSPRDVDALKAVVKHVGDVSEEFLLRFERIHPGLNNLP